MSYPEKVEKAEQRLGHAVDYLIVGSLIYVASWVNFAIQVARYDKLTQADTRPPKKN